MMIRVASAGIAGILFAVSSAGAQPAPTFEKKGDVKDVKDVNEVDWTAKAEAGVVASTGNSSVTTLTIGADASRKDKDNKLDLTFAAAYARATTRLATDANGDGTIDQTELSEKTATSAKNAAAKLRYDRYLTAENSLYVAALAAVDVPAGKDFAGGAQAGYSRALYKEKEQEVLAELGYDLTYVKLSAGSSSTIHSARAFAGYKGKLTDDTAAEASLEALFNGNEVKYGMRTASAFEATRLVGIASFTTALSTKISLAASFTLKYDHFPAPLPKIGDLPFAAGFEPAADTTDTITKLSLIVKFL